MVTNNGVKSMRLTKLVYNDVLEMAKILVGLILKRRTRADPIQEMNQQMRDLFSWLCQGNSSSVLSRVISSYTPTIKALSHARQKALIFSHNKTTKTLLVAMDETPGQARLSTAAESAEIAMAIEGLGTTQIMNMPTPSAVLQCIDSCEIVHCICHGVSDHNNPSKSHLILQPDAAGENQEADGKLSVLSISNTNSARSQLAFLSACSTAENPPTGLVDEVIHVASAFQLAGFSHVIGTM
ncbi:hypothetical protein K432DRAFT_443405 [Lepidopterella palustris CBS 459.81]|uniref:CHAT domain-containing protein n=1 Tax=Lepidopterella palustris CBS 459.81 TaxID=1314670 RepID=A0A8E2E9W2_9PEZI|nr:hypothetical protein K432DRAFT_443405 [Lepidopterella palustris CBS 459.81]